MELYFEDLRSERRSFYCPNILWKEIHKRTTEKLTMSKYIIQAIKEKMEKENQEKTHTVPPM